MSLYTVRKIHDLLTDKKCDSSKMCGTLAYVTVPSDKAIEAADSENIEAMKKLKYDDIWERQDTLEPKIGYTVVFHSTKFDAGWFGTSCVCSYITLPSGDVEITTNNSIYLCRIKK